MCSEGRCCTARQPLGSPLLLAGRAPLHIRQRGCARQLALQLADRHLRLRVWGHGRSGRGIGCLVVAGWLSSASCRDVLPVMSKSLYGQN